MAAGSRFSPNPLFWLAACFASGIAAAAYVDLEWRIPAAVFAGGVIFAVAGINRSIGTAGLFLAFTAVGSFCWVAETRSVVDDRLKRLYAEHFVDAGEPVEIEGVLRSEPETAVNGYFLTLSADKLVRKNISQKISGAIRLFVPINTSEASDEFSALELRYGSRIRFAGTPDREERFRNPGSISRTEILDRQQIDLTATVKSPLLIEKLGSERVFAPLAFIYHQRQRLIEETSQLFSVSTSGVLIASLLGNKHFLDRNTAEVFREGGTFHILVISGLHITFIGGFTLLLVRRFTNRRIYQFVVSTSVLWAYTLAVGAEVPVTRAAMMFTILLFSQVIYRKGTLLNAFGACVLVLLVWRPSDLFDPSFQLTFLSVAALVAMAFPLVEKLRSIGEWSPSARQPFPPNAPRWLVRFCETLYWNENAWTIESKRNIWSGRIFKSPYLKWLEVSGLKKAAVFIFEGILVSLVVQIWLLPLLVVYFHRVSVVSIVLNLWVGVIIALEGFSALIAVLASRVSDMLALPFVQMTEILNRLLLWLPQLLVESDLASFRVPVYSGPVKAVYFLYLLPVIVLTFVTIKWNPFPTIETGSRRMAMLILPAVSVVLVLLFGSVIVFHPYSAPEADGRLRIDFLDVGQGDAAFITFPNGETMLVDGGGRANFDDDDGTEAFEPDIPRIGEAVVSEFLWERGISRIDHLMGTHADADHMQGLADVAENFVIGNAWVGSTPVRDLEYDGLTAALAKRGASLMLLKKGDRLTIGEVTIDVLHPDSSVDNGSENDRSIVLRIQYGSRVFLLTGDVEERGEHSLLMRPDLLAADVVKVAHHGSRTSSMQAFVDAADAEFAVISVGRSSMFGHPHSEVVERWERSGAKVMTTGERGTISISTDGKDLEIRTFVP